MNEEDYKQLLEKRLKQQQIILKTSQKDAEAIRQPHCRDRGEIAEERERAVIIDNTLQQTQHNIDEIKKALNKIKIKKFGLCEHCNNNISTQRLTVYPEAALCIHCQEIKHKK